MDRPVCARGAGRAITRMWHPAGRAGGVAGGVGTSAGSVGHGVRAQVEQAVPALGAAGDALAQHQPRPLEAHDLRVAPRRVGKVDPCGGLGAFDWLVIAAIPVVGVAIAMVTARFTVLSALRKML